MGSREKCFLNIWVCLFVTLDLRINWWRVLWFWVDRWVCYIDIWDDHAHLENTEKQEVYQ